MKKARILCGFRGSWPYNLDGCYFITVLMTFPATVTRTFCCLCASFTTGAYVVNTQHSGNDPFGLAFLLTFRESAQVSGDIPDLVKPAFTYPDKYGAKNKGVKRCPALESERQPETDSSPSSAHRVLLSHTGSLHH